LSTVDDRLPCAPAEKGEGTHKKQYNEIKTHMLTQSSRVPAQARTASKNTRTRQMRKKRKEPSNGEGDGQTAKKGDDSKRIRRQRRESGQKEKDTA